MTRLRLCRNLIITMNQVCILANERVEELVNDDTYNLMSYHSKKFITYHSVQFYVHSYNYYMYILSPIAHH